MGYKYSDPSSGFTEFACIMEDTICLQCGEKGWDNSFVYCVKCLGFAVHRYCLDVIPATYNEYVRWICDDCEVKEQHKHKSLKQDVIQYQTGDHDISKNINRVSEIEANKNDTVVIGAQISVDSIPCQLGDDDISKNINEVSEIEKKKNDSDGVKCVELASKLSSMESRGVIDKNATVVEVNEINKENGNDDISSKENKGRTENVISKSNMEKDDLPCTPDAKRDTNGHSIVPDNGSLSKSAKKRRRHAKNWTSKKRRRTLKSSKINLEEHKLGTSSAELNSEHHITSCNGSSKNSSKNWRKSSKNKKTIVIGLENLENNGVDLENLWSDMSTERRITRSSNIENREFVPREERSFASYDTSNSWKVFQEGCQESPEPLPIIKPIWRGSFKIWNKKYDIHDGLMAHLSNRACQKVYEEARQFQTVLHLEMLPKTEVWPKSFQTSKPSAENIALYFFPSEISERAFDHLVEDMLGEELAMRATVQNAELLIFPSTELPMKYWRFQDKHYLWGVFRGKQPLPLHSHSGTPRALSVDT